MERVSIVIGSALIALAVGTFEFVAFGFHRERMGQSTWGETETLWYLLLVLPALVAAGVSAFVCVRDSRFHEQSQREQTFRVCRLAYILYAPLFTAGLFLTWLPGSATSGFVNSVVGVATMGLLVAGVVFLLSVIPVFALEYMIIDMARRIGV